MNLLFLADLNSLHDRKWISYFAEKGYLCCVISRSKTSSQRNAIKNIKILGSIEDYSTIRPWKNGSQFEKLRFWLQQYSIDVFHILYAEPNALWAMVKQHIKVPILLTTRGTDVLKTIPEFFRSKSVLGLLVKNKYRKALNYVDHITVTSLGQRDSITKFFKKKVPLEVIRTGVDLEQILASHAQTPDMLHGRSFMLFPRRMTKTYDHDLSIDAIEILPDNLKKKYIMVFVDSDSYAKDYVSSIRARMSETTDVKFLFLSHQRQKNIWELYKQSSLVVMNPVSDGSPVSALEVMVLGKPLILGNAQYDDDLFSGITKMNSRSFTELRDLMVREITNPTEYTGYTLVKNKANRQSEMAKLDKIYLKLASRK